MSGRGSTEWIKLERPVLDQLRQLSARSDATLFMVLLSVFSLLLKTLGSDARQSIGIPVRGRSRAQTEPLMGYFTNLLPLILDADNNQSFEQLLKHVKQELVGAFAAPDVPIEHLLSSLTGQGAASPLYLALFSYQDARSRPVNWGNLRHERLEVAKKGATEDFGLWFIESDAGLVGGLTFNTDLYRPDTAVILHARLLKLLAKVAQHPTQPVSHLLAEFITVKEATVQPEPKLNTAPLIDATTVVGTKPAVATFESEAEKFMAGVWAAVLKVSVVERGDNFFDLGGNSLLAMQAVAQAEQHFKTKVHEQRYVFETLAQLAQAYQQDVAQVTTEKKSLIGRLFGRNRAGS